MEEKKVLLLRICAEGFKNLLAGKDKIRYREVKPYWETRLLEKNGDPKTFDEVHIKNGYKETSPMIIIEFKAMHGTEKHEGKDCFKIELGDILDVKNVGK